MKIDQILEDIYAIAPFIESMEPVTIRRSSLKNLMLFSITGPPNRSIRHIMDMQGLFPNHPEIQTGTPYFFLESADGYLLNYFDIMTLEPDLYDLNAVSAIYMVKLEERSDREHILKAWKMSPVIKLEKDSQGWLFAKQPGKEKSHE